MTYWLHRLFHMPWLYKNFHKLHHTYKQPTAFSVTAIHPVEFVILQCVYIIPMFTIPLHWSKCLILDFWNFLKTFYLFQFPLRSTFCTRITMESLIIRASLSKRPFGSLGSPIAFFMTIIINTSMSILDSILKHGIR